MFKKFITIVAIAIGLSTAACALVPPESYLPNTMSLSQPYRFYSPIAGKYQRLWSAPGHLTWYSEPGQRERFFVVEGSMQNGLPAVCRFSVNPFTDIQADPSGDGGFITIHVENRTMENGESCPMLSETSEATRIFGEVTVAYPALSDTAEEYTPIRYGRRGITISR